MILSRWDVGRVPVGQDRHPGVVFRRFLGNQPLEAGAAAKGGGTARFRRSVKKPRQLRHGVAAAVFPLTHNIRLPLITEANV